MAIMIVVTVNDKDNNAGSNDNSTFTADESDEKMMKWFSKTIRNDAVMKPI